MKIRVQNLFVALALLALSILNSQFPTCFAQGSLTPPGAPAPMMKSLDQIEPRTAITNLPFDAGGDLISSRLQPKGAGFGIANVTDDVLAFVRSALDNAVLPHFPAARVPGVVFQEACYWRELQVVAVAGGAQAERAEVRCQVVSKGWQRDFLGFNRARGAVIEATILATRLHLHDRETVMEELRRYEEIVRKTGGDKELAALERVLELVRRGLSDRGH
jgi:hypothetical protein